MKKLIIVSLSLLMVASASAQRGFHGGGFRGGFHGGGGFYARPRVSVGIGIGGYSPFYGGYGYGYGGYYGGLYSPFYGYPYLGYGYGYPYYGGGSYYSAPRRTYTTGSSYQLDLQIQDIRNDYNHRIWLVKHDKSIKRKERKKQVHELEHDRDKAIIQAKMDFYNKPPQTPRRHNFNSNNNSN